MMIKNLTKDERINEKNNIEITISNNSFRKVNPTNELFQNIDLLTLFKIIIMGNKVDQQNKRIYKMHLSVYNYPNYKWRSRIDIIVCDKYGSRYNYIQNVNTKHILTKLSNDFEKYRNKCKIDLWCALNKAYHTRL